ncbi:MAG: ABC transporter ATP-binding protein [Gammaproteobacteria bacterium]|nr:ABC transporter ATP-binding protein [Gammaproteobacteria bacterium]
MGWHGSHGGGGGSRYAARTQGSFRDLGHLSRLFPYLRRYTWPLAAAVVGYILAAALENTIPLLIMVAVDSIVEKQPNVMWPAIIIVGIVLCRFVVFVFARRIVQRIGVATSYDLRKRIFHHVQLQGPQFFHRFNTGDIMSRAVNDINMVRRLMRMGWINIVRFVLAVSIGLAFMFSLAPQLTIFVVIPIPFVGIVAYIMSRRLFPYMRDQMASMSAVTSFVQENLNGIRTIQAAAQEDEEIKRFSDVSTNYVTLVYRATRFRAIMNIIMPYLTAIAPVITLGYGGSLVLQGEISLGTFAAFFAYLTMITGPVRMLGMSLSTFTSAAASTQRLFEVLDFAPEIKDEPTQDLPESFEGHLELRNLTYTHPGSPEPALLDIDIDVQPGETIAILGRVGSGKSTMLKALVRLINTPKGTVFLDGHDVCDYPLHQLREVITLIPQDPFLFSETLRSNLTYDEPTRADEPIWGASNAASLTEAIRQFPLQLLTIVGERGITLSGGQKQRATLARGLIRRAAVLAMDDCFSSVDTETEEKILSGLQKLRKGKTTVLISHRVSTARHADRIFVMDNGRIIESGSHQQLLALGGYYANLEAVQSNQDQDRARKAKLLHDIDELDEARQAMTAGGGGS